MRTCYVSLPFGRKIDREGRPIDFDALFVEGVAPTLAQAGFQASRAEDVPPGTDWQKARLRELMASDLVIADVSVPSGNTLYELGVRHALRREGTIVIASRAGGLPFDLMHLRVILYEPDDSGRLTDRAAEAFRSALLSTIRALTETAVVTSPIFQLFPELDVSLPPEISQRARSRRARPTPAERSFAQRVIIAPDQVVLEVVEIEGAVRKDDSSDPFEYVSLLRKYRDLAEWDRIIRLAEEAPPAVANSPETKRMLALALNRRGSSGDQDRAISVMQTLVDADPWDSESRGVLGLICKERFEAAKQRGDLQSAAADLARALESYREAFRINPSDYYAGVNVIYLLLEKPDDPHAREEIRKLLPQVRKAVHESTPRTAVGVRELSTEVQLAVIAGDWSAAESAAQKIVDQEGPDWMVKSAVRELRQLNVKLPDLADRKNAASLTEKLAAAVSRKLAL